MLAAANAILQLPLLPVLFSGFQGGAITALRLRGVPWATNAYEITKFFSGMSEAVWEASFWKQDMRLACCLNLLIYDNHHELVRRLVSWVVDKLSLPVIE